MSEALVATLLASATLGAVLVGVAARAARLDPRAPDRLVTELRLAQVSALLLVMAAAIYMGLALGHETTEGTGLVIAIAVGFFVVAAVATTWEPTQALTVLALAWGTHALVDLAHVADLLPAAIAPAWYPTACAIYDVAVAAVCYLPVLRR